MPRPTSIPWLVLLSLTLAACGLLRPRAPEAPVAPQARVTPFSSGTPGGPMPPGWYAAALPKFRRITRYELVDDGGTTVVRALAENSSSGLVQDVNVEPREFPVVRWRWKVPRPIPGADNTRREGDDAPARVEFVFSGPTPALPFNERVFFAQVKAMTGIEVPYATLDYSWGSGAAPGTIIVNEWTSRIRTLLVRSGPQGMGEWVSEQRNVYEDFKKMFGEEPERITQVVIYTDSDATGTTAEGYYGDIEFVGAAQPDAEDAATAR